MKLLRLQLLLLVFLQMRVIFGLSCTMKPLRNVSRLFPKRRNSFLRRKDLFTLQLRETSSFHSSNEHDRHPFQPQPKQQNPFIKLLKQTLPNESPSYNTRFWSKTFSIHFPNNNLLSQNNNNNQNQDHLDTLFDEIRQLFIDQKESLTLPNSENGMIIIPSYHLMIPLHNNIIQTQYAILDESFLAPVGTPSFAKLEEEEKEERRTIKMMICGFAPRAAHVAFTDEELQRPVNEERRQALNQALVKVTNVTGLDLLSERYAGTPPARIYRSFVAPRAKGDYTRVDTIETAAGRAAYQIEQALRQLRADEAAYLVNTDKSLGTVITQKKLNPIILVLDNVRSANNVGSMFRTAETAGIQEVVTCGITAHPPHNPKLRKTAFTAIDIVPSRHFVAITEAIQQLRKEGCLIIVMETTTKSINYTELNAKQFPTNQTFAIVVGNEMTGVDPTIIEQADYLLEIPTYGIKNSLNVCSAASIMIFELLRQLTSKDHNNVV